MRPPEHVGESPSTRSARRPASPRPTRRLVTQRLPSLRGVRAAASVRRGALALLMATCRAAATAQAAHPAASASVDVDTEEQVDTRPNMLVFLADDSGGAAASA